MHWDGAPGLGGEGRARTEQGEVRSLAGQGVGGETGGARLLTAPPRQSPRLQGQLRTPGPGGTKRNS